MNYASEHDLKVALQKIPRQDRAKAQGMRYQFIINERMVRRLTRRYWMVQGTEVKLDKATEMIPLIEAAALLKEEARPGV